MQEKAVLLVAGARQAGRGMLGLQLLEDVGEELA